MTDFIPVLAAAVLILTALFVVFGGIIILGDTSTIADDTSSSGTYYNEIVLAKNIDVADYQAGYEVARLGGNVSAGIITNNEKVVSFNVVKYNDITRGKLALKVIDTNSYGRLFVTINGHVIYSNVTPVGDQTVIFNKTILNATNNILKIQAEGSGWRIWAPTTYIFDARISGETYDYSKQTTNFDVISVPSDAKFNIEISSREGKGDISVIINGYRVFKGKSSGFKTFDTNVLKEGSNVVEFSADTGSRYHVDYAYIEFE